MPTGVFPGVERSAPGIFSPQMDGLSLENGTKARSHSMANNNAFENKHLGYVSLWRSLVNHPHYQDSAWVHLWVHLLLKATHSGYNVMFNGQIVHLEPGQLIAGRLSLSSETGLHPSRVERLLKTLEIEQQIEQRTCTKNRLITVLNWSSYQVSEQRNEQRANNGRTATEQRANTGNKVDKADKVDNAETDLTPPAQHSAALVPGALSKAEVVQRYVENNGYPRLSYSDWVSYNNQTNGWGSMRDPIAAFRGYFRDSHERYEDDVRVKEEAAAMRTTTS